MDGMVNLNYMSYIGDIHVGSAIYTKAHRERGAWGIGGSFISYGNFKEVDASRMIKGEFSAKDMSVQAFYSYDLSDKWRGGLSMKMLYSHLAEYSSFGIGVDAGLSYYDEEKGLSFGVALKNIGAQLKAYDSERRQLPWDIQMGISKRMAHAPIRVSVTAMHLKQWKFKYVEETLAEKNLEDSFVQTLAKHRHEAERGGKQIGRFFDRRRLACIPIRYRCIGGTLSSVGTFANGEFVDVTL